MVPNKLSRGRSDHGFSLLELIVVLVITGLLMGLVGPSFINRIESTRQRYALDQLRTELAQLPRWARLAGTRLQYELIKTPVVLDGSEVVALPEGWSVQFKPALVILPNLVCSEASGKVLNDKGEQLASFAVKAPDCRMVEE